MVERVDLADEDARARADSLDPSRSILLQAPAGSGKTTVLTERFLRLLAEVDEPEEIVALTFTRKAAAEMRERVLRALRGEIEGDTAHEEAQRRLAERARRRARERDWKLEESPTRLRILTLDALNHRIASQLPVAARAGGQLRVADRPRQLYRLAARRTLADAEQESALQPCAELLFERLDNDFGRLESLLAEMLEKRAHWLPRLLGERGLDLARRVEESLQAIAADRLGSAARELGPVGPEGLSIATGAAAARARAGDPAPGPWRALIPAPGPSAVAAFAAGHPESLAEWQAVAALAVTSGGALRRSLTRREGFPTEEPDRKARAVAWLQDLARTPHAEALLAALLPLPPLRLDVQDRASLDALTRILGFAAQELEVVFQELGQVDYTYVAGAARRALTEEGDPTELALRLGARIRHLLVDEFQDTSIEQLEMLRALTSGWDGGDGRTLFAVGDPMQSIYLFREAEVGLFLRARERGLGALRFASLRLARNFRSDPTLVGWVTERFARVFPALDDVRTSAVSFLASRAARPARADARVELACTTAGDEAGEAEAIADRIAAVRRDDPSATIAVLVSSRSHAAPITGALELRGFPVAGVDLVPLEEVPVVRDLAALTRALDHLGDRTAWLTVLRAPWCGLPLEALHALVAGSDEPIVWTLLGEAERRDRLEPDARRRLERTRAVLARALEARDRAGIAEWVEATWLELGGPAACTQDAELEHARAFFEALARRSRAIDWSGPAELDELLAELHAGNPGAPGDAIQIMTIHGAKGLEFDHVVLPGLGRRLRNDTEPLMRWIELPRIPEGSDLLIAPLAPLESRERHPIATFIATLQKERLRHERARLLYVAATRARRGLHLFGHLAEGDPNAPRRPPTGTLLEVLWPAISADFPHPRPAGSLARAPATTPKLERLCLDWTPPSLDGSPRIESLEVANFEPGRRTPVVAPRAGQCARWVYDASHRDVREGLELTGLVEGALTSVAIDRTFIDAEGVRWLLSICEDVMDSAGSLDAELARRRPMLERWVALARHLGPEPARAAVYFPARGELRELSERA